MDSTAPIGRPRRGLLRWKWLAVAALLLPCAGFFLSNLLLNSGSIRHRIEQKITARLGLTCQLDHASWSPWNGISLTGITVSQPAQLQATIAHPLAHIRAVIIAPVWRAWLRGRLEIHTVDLDSPELNIPIELLAQIAKPPVPQASPPPLPLPPVVQAVPPTAPAPPALAAPPAVVTKPADKVAPPLPAQPTGWVYFKNASIAVISSHSGTPLVALKNATGALPIAGDTAQSSIKIADISLLGQPTFSGFTAQFKWQPPLLELLPLELNFPGGKVFVNGQLIANGGLPFQFAAKLNPQPLEPHKIPFGGTLAAASVTAQAAMRGLTLAPTTWQGDLLAEASTISLVLPDKTAKFDDARSVIVLRGGALACLDARFIGDELSLLGNALLLPNGHAAAVLRLVAPPETLANIAKRGFPNQAPPALIPLSSPQRAALDLNAFGTLDQWDFQLGKNGPLIPLKSLHLAP
jgi:hypothetical protein